MADDDAGEDGERPAGGARREEGVAGGDGAADAGGEEDGGERDDGDREQRCDAFGVAGGVRGPTRAGARGNGAAQTRP